MSKNDFFENIAMKLTPEEKKEAVEILKNEFRKQVSFVTYAEAKMLLNEEEFAEFDAGCKLMNKHMRSQTDWQDLSIEDQNKIDRQFELRRIAASRKKNA